MKQELREARFWKGVAISGEDECWNWLLKSKEDGYGRTTYNGKCMLAHRIAFQLHHKRNIEEGKILLHSCDNRLCCNIKHLKEGTHKENAQDKMNKNRFIPMKGSSNGNSKLTLEQVDQIRTKYATIKISQTKLGQEYGVSQHAISRIINKKVWS